MEFYFYKGKKIGAADKEKLTPEEQEKCRPWKEQGRGDKPGYKKQDGKWYEVSPAITESVANIPFNRFPGSRISLGPIAYSANDALSGTLTDLTGSGIPGVLALKTVLTFGDTNSGSVSAINIAARGIYSWVRHQNSGRSNYEANDLMLYVAAMDQIYAAYAEACRAYEIAVTYSMENRNVPKLIAHAANVNINSIQKDLANYRAKLNVLASKINSLCVPKKFNIFKRHYFICANVFSDSNSPKSQYYMFVPSGYMLFNATKETSGGALVFSFTSKGGSKSGTLRTGDTILSFLDEMVEAVLQDEDMNIMSGDILKAYGRENLYQLAELDANSSLSVVFNEDVLQQIENSSTFPTGDIFELDTSGTSSITLYKQVNPSAEVGASFLTCMLTSDRAEALVNYGATSTRTVYTPTYLYYNSHKDKVNPIDNLEWMRDVTGFGSFDTEIITVYELYTRVYDENGTESVKNDVITSWVSDQITPDVLATVIGTLFKFDWHPIIYIVNFTASEKAIVAFGGDLKNFTLVASLTVENIHESCITGALNALKMSAT